MNSFGLGFDQPPSSRDQDPIKRLTAEKDLTASFSTGSANAR
jgi:hypothetical protein